MTTKRTAWARLKEWESSSDANLLEWCGPFDGGVCYRWKITARNDRGFVSVTARTRESAAAAVIAALKALGAWEEPA